MPAPLVCLTACQRDPNERSRPSLKFTTGMGTTHQTSKWSSIVGQVFIFHSEMQLMQLWQCWRNVLRCFGISGASFSSRSLKVWSSFWHELVISWRKSWEWVFPVRGSPRPFTQWLLGYAASPLVTSSCSRVCLEVVTTQCRFDTPRGEKKVPFATCSYCRHFALEQLKVGIEFTWIDELSLTEQILSKAQMNDPASHSSTLFSTHRTVAFCVSLDIGSDIRHSLRWGWRERFSITWPGLLTGAQEPKGQCTEISLLLLDSTKQAGKKIGAERFHLHDTSRFAFSSRYLSVKPGR